MAGKNSPTKSEVREPGSFPYLGVQIPKQSGIDLVPIDQRSMEQFRWKDGLQGFPRSGHLQVARRRVFTHVFEPLLVPGACSTPVFLASRWVPCPICGLIWQQAFGVLKGQGALHSLACFPVSHTVSRPALNFDEDDPESCNAGLL